MLMFCSLALLVKIKLCGGNLCDSFFFPPSLYSFLPSSSVAIAVPLILLLNRFPILQSCRMKHMPESRQIAAFFFFFQTFTFY